MGGNGNPKRTERRPRDLSRHVVNLRSWKARKRIRTIRGRTSWTRYIFRQLAYLLSACTIASALLSCVPFGPQGRAILWTWGVGVLSVGLALCLHALYETRHANRILATNLICLGVSFVAAITLVY